MPKRTSIRGATTNDRPILIKLKSTLFQGRHSLKLCQYIDNISTMIDVTMYRYELRLWTKGDVDNEYV